MSLTRTLKAGAALSLILTLAACGMSRHQDVVAEDIFAPAVGTDDAAIDSVQTIFDDPFAPEAQLITDTAQRDASGGELDPFVQERTELTDATVEVIPVASAPIYQPQMPVIQQVAVTPQSGAFNCAVAPTSKSKLMMFRQACGGIAPQGAGYQSGGYQAEDSLAGIGQPAQQVFMSPSFDCAMNPSSKAELAYFRANCLAAVSAPVPAPARSRVAVEPPPAVIEAFVEEVVEATPEPALEAYDCNILPTSRAELELYQKFCG